MQSEGEAVPTQLKMMRLSTLMVALLTPTLFGQESDVPYAPDSDGPRPTFTSERISLSFPGKYSSLRDVDFRKLDEVDDKDVERDSDNHFSAELNSIYYLSGGTPSKRQSALVVKSWFDAGGSSSQGGLALVYTVSNGRLRALQRIRWDTHFQAGQPTDSFDPNTKSLVIRSAHYIPGDAHCCVSAMDVVTFQWKGDRFVQSEIRTELSEYGKRNGKILPRKPLR